MPAPTHRSPAAHAARNAGGDADAPRRARSHEWMVPAGTDDPAYTDPAAGAAWLARLMAAARAKKQPPNITTETQP
jgi:hypothetical protein